jgi:transcriptional regulator with XRE-family HTH domain
MTVTSTHSALSLGQQLRAARLRAGMKPKDVARMAKLSAAAVYNCERADRGGRMRTLIKLVQALGCKVHS